MSSLMHFRTKNTQFYMVFVLEITIRVGNRYEDIQRYTSLDDK